MNIMLPNESLTAPGQPLVQSLAAEHPETAKGDAEHFLPASIAAELSEQKKRAPQYGMASAISFSVLALVDKGVPSFAKDTLLELSFSQICGPCANTAMLEKWHDARQKYPELIRFVCRECNKPVVLRRYTCRKVEIQQRTPTYEFARFPGVTHSCVKFNHTWASPNRLPLSKNLLSELLAHERDPGSVFLQLRKPAREFLRQARNPIRSSRSPRSEKRRIRHGLGGLLTACIESSGLCFYYPNRAYGRRFRELMPRIGQYLASNASLAKKFSAKIFLPEVVERSDQQGAFLRACEANSLRNVELEGACLVSGRIRGYGPAARDPNLVQISLFKWWNQTLTMSADKWAEGVKSFRLPPNLVDEPNQEIEAIMIALVRPNGDKFEIQEAAWCHVNSFGVVLESDYEGAAFNMLVRHRIAFAKLVHLEIDCNGMGVRSDAIALAKGLSPMPVEVDPNRSKDERRKRARDGKYRRANQPFVRIEDPNGMVLPSQLHPYRDALGEGQLEYSFVFDR